MKQFRTFISLCCIMSFSVHCIATAPPIPGIGIVVKKNPGGGAGKVVTDKNGQFSIHLEPGEYLISISQEDMNREGSKLLTALNPLNKYELSASKTGYSSDCCIKWNPAGKGVLIVPEGGATLTGSCTLDESAIASLKDNGRVLQFGVKFSFFVTANNGCPPGYEKKNGSCVPIGDRTPPSPLQNKQAGNGHVLRGGYGRGIADGHRYKFGRDNYTTVSLGAGSIIPGSNMKNVTGDKPRLSINLGASQAVIVRSHFSLGVSLEGQYGISTQDISPAIPAAYHVTGETSSAVEIKKGSKGKSIAITAGPQLNIFAGDRFLISPVLRAGYMSVTKQSAEATQTTGYPGLTQTFRLLSESEIKTSGFVFTPAIRLQYFLSKRIGIWAEGNYAMAGSIHSVTTGFVPAGNPDRDGKYALSQMENGSIQRWEKTAKANWGGATGGVIFNIGNNPAEYRCPCCNKMVASGKNHNKWCCYKELNPSLPATARHSAETWDGSLTDLYNTDIEAVAFPLTDIDKLITLINTDGGRKAIRAKDGNGLEHILVMSPAETGGTVTTAFPVIPTGPVNFTKFNAGTLTCQGDCIVGSPANYPNIPLCMNVGTNGNFQCTSCASSNTACHQVTAQHISVRWPHSLAYAHLLSETDLNEETPELKEMVHLLLPATYRISKVQVVQEGERRFCIVLATDNNSGILLTSELQKTKKAFALQNEWLVISDPSIPATASDLPALMKTVQQKATAERKHDYVGHVTLMK